MRRFALSFLALLLVPAFGCSDDPAGPEDELTSAEIQVLAGALLDQAVGESLMIPIEASSGASDGPAAAPVTLDFTVEGPIDCEVSGLIQSTTTVTGTVDDETGAADLTLSVTQDPIACVVQNQGGTVQVQMDGAPGTVAEIDIQRSNLGELAVVGELTSTIQVTASDDRSGTCSFLMDFEGIGDEGGLVSYDISGSLCGLPFTGTGETGG